MAVTITFNAVNVNTVNRGSSVNLGEVALPGWASHGKNNYGNGNFFGISSVISVNNIMDNDVVDVPINDIQANPTGQNQQV